MQDNPSWWQFFRLMQKDPKVKRDLGGCYSMPLATFESLLQKTFKSMSPISPGQHGQLRRGCIGVTALLQTCGNSATSQLWPELAPNTTCYLDYGQAAASTCAGKKQKFMFTVEGVWEGGTAPKPGKDGSIPNDSLSENDGIFNYMALLRGGGNYLCVFADNEDEPNSPMTVKVCNLKGTTKCASQGPDYRDEMFCVTCSDCTLE